MLLPQGNEALMNIFWLKEHQSNQKKLANKYHD